MPEACFIAARWPQTSALRSGASGRRSRGAGDVTYETTPLEPPADGEVLICCARPDSDVVLDM